MVLRFTIVTEWLGAPEVEAAQRQHRVSSVHLA
jgi:hypothetical protein